jgi:hypothetical protein
VRAKREVEARCNLVLKLLEPTVLELHDPPAVTANQMVVVLRSIRALEASAETVEVALHGEALRHQEAYRPIHGGDADGRVTTMNGVAQLLERDVPFDLREHLEHQSTLCGVSNVRELQGHPPRSGAWLSLCSLHGAVGSEVNAWRNGTRSGAELASKCGSHGSGSPMVRPLPMGRPAVAYSFATSRSVAS